MPTVFWRYVLTGRSCISKTAIERAKREYNPAAVKNYFVLLVRGNLCERIKSARRICGGSSSRQALLPQSKRTGGGGEEKGK